MLDPISWQYSHPEITTCTQYSTAFRAWHRAHLIGLSLVSCKIGHIPFSADQLDRLNLFVEGRGAWRCSNLDYYEARRALNVVLADQCEIVARVGPIGGRWPTASTAKQILWDSGQSDQAVFNFKL